MTRSHARDESHSEGEPLLPTAYSLLPRYRDLLAEAPLNLTSARDRQEIERRHIAESLAVVRALEQAGRLPVGARVIDVGSGGGLPGLPLAIARPDTRVTLLEATAKKAAFLERATHDLGLINVCVLAARAETAAHQPEEREAYDLAVARAVASLATLVELTLPFVQVGGALAAMKGSRAVEEIQTAQGALHRCGGGPIESLPLATDTPNLRLLIVPKVAQTPPDLPRRAGIPAKKPLR